MMGAKAMSGDLVDSAVAWLPHAPGWVALGFSALAYFPTAND